MVAWYHYCISRLSVTEYLTPSDRMLDLVVAVFVAVPDVGGG